MLFWQIILSCVFSHLETFCPKGDEDDKLDTFLRAIDWRLPKVRWNYDAPPPPPPPATFGNYHDLVAADPEGMEDLRERLLEYWPSLTYVASQTYGNSNPLKHNPFLESHPLIALGLRRLECRSRTQRLRDWLWTCILRFALLNVDGLSFDVAL